MVNPILVNIFLWIFSLLAFGFALLGTVVLIHEGIEEIINRYKGYYYVNTYAEGIAFILGGLLILFVGICVICLFNPWLRTLIVIT